MSVTHRKDTGKVAELEARIEELQEEIKQKDDVISEQITNTQLALCELFESVVDFIG